ncbi:MAG: class I tRNA ligase family protein, partial [Ignavibacteria bacterium]
SFGTGRFGKWLEENRDWALSRNRFWGTPLPVWQYTDESGKEHYECIGSIQELKDRSINFGKVYADEKSLDLHKPFIDEIIINSKDGKQMTRVNELADVWFDSGCVPFAQHHYPFENKELFEKNYPADFIAEGIDQTRGWFYTMHAIGTFLFDKPAYKNVIVNGHILDKNGKKMSKSLGNIVNPFDMMEKYGADVLRWYMISSSPVGNSKLFNENDLIEVQNKFFDTLINVVRFFIIYSNLTEFSYDAKKSTEPVQRPVIDRWILSKFNTVRAKYFELMDDYDITKASRILYDFTIDELSNWYVRRNRKRLRGSGIDGDSLSGYQTLYEVITELLKLIAPVSPFLSDKLYMTLSDSDTSVHLTEFSEVNESLTNSPLEEEMQLAQNIVYLIRSIRVKNNLKVRQPLRQILIPVLNDDDRQKIQNVKDVILEEVNVRELNFIEGDSDIIVKKSKPNFKSIGPKFGKDVKAVQKIINGLTSAQISELEKTGKLSLEGFDFTRDDIEIYTNNIEGWIVDTYGDLTIALDTKLDDELIEEGIIREFVNRIQNFRRTNDFDVSDKVKIYFRSSENISLAIKRNIDYIKAETLSENIESANGYDFAFVKSEINGEPVELFLKKIN